MFFIMESDKQKVYIIDLYNKFDSEDVVSVFKINGRWWAIKCVSLKWGKPQLHLIEENENPYIHFHLYNTLEEAQSYVHKIKQLEGARF